MIIWIELQPIDTKVHAWKDIAMDASGLILAAVASQLGIFKSIDGGLTWADITPSGLAARNWTTISISGDGQVILAGMYESPPDGICVISLNGGTTWLLDKYPPAANWYRSLQVSRDGGTLIGANGVSQYISKSNGTTWNQVSPGGANCEAVANQINSDSSIIIFGMESGKGIWKSINGGWDWTNIIPLEGLSPCTVSMSDDGQKIIVTGYVTPSYYVWYSINGGTTWTNITPGVADWAASTVSLNGTIMAIGSPTTDKKVYVSYDETATWELNNPSSASSLPPIFIASDNKIFAMVSSRLWTDIIDPTPAPPIPVATDATSITSVAFTANWDASVGATGYRLDVSDDNFVTILTGYTDLIVAGISQVVSGLTVSTTYKYRVRAIGIGGTSGNSNVITAITIAPPVSVEEFAINVVTLAN